MVKETKDISFCKNQERGLSFIFDVSVIDDTHIRKDEEQLYTTFFVSRKKTNMKELSLGELEKEIRDCVHAKMIMIMKKEDRVYEVRELLNKLSKERGICSPVIEMDRAILYFPKLRYSDMGLLDYICIHNLNLDKYSLKMTGEQFDRRNVCLK